jgi:Zn-dependent protease with chaperone function
MDSSQSQAILDSLAALSRQTEKQADIFTAKLAEQAAQVLELTEKISEQQVAIDMAKHATPSAPQVKKEQKTIQSLK